MKVQVIEDWLNNLCTFILAMEGQVKVKQNQSKVKKRWEYKGFLSEDWEQQLLLLVDFWKSKEIKG